MIVTCEACKSRYKLDEAKITGRGAKITCPKCEAVFVVYAKDQGNPKKADSAPKIAPTGAAAPSAAPARPRASTGGGTGATTSSGAGTAGAASSDARDSAKAATGAGTAAGGAAAGFAAAQTPARNAAWDDEPTRMAGDEGTHEVRAPRQPAEPPAVPSTAPSGVLIATSTGPATIDPTTAAARAATLDFRAVGVTAWKVKVKIGLIYDFSDIKTLRKYIQDGRVTATDVVSWDGKSWRAIGEIPDLDIYFVETWEMLAAQRAAGDAPANATLAPAPPAPEVRNAIEEAAVAPKTGGEPNQFKDPFAEARRKQQEKADLKRTAPQPPLKSEPPPKKSQLPAALLVLLLLLAAVFGSMRWMQATKEPAEPSAATPAAPENPDAEPDIREAINRDLQEALAQRPANDAMSAVPEERTVSLPGDDRELIPVRSGPAAASGSASNANGSASRVPKGAVPVRRDGPAASQGSSIKQSDAPAADHEAVGDDAARSGDWATARQAYGKAVALDGRNARLLAKLGRAQAKSGDGAAEATLKKAAGMGARDALKWLGDYAADNGDVSGARGYYQQYLDGNPSDAADVRRKLEQIGG